MAFNLGDVLKNVPNSGTTGRQSITYLPLGSLDSDAGNFYELRDIDKLADNISVAGLQQPILVRESKELGRYTIVSGHRRAAALRLLAADDPDAWREVPCIIETDSVSPSLQQLRLIYANANTRQLTSAEIGEQAAQVEKLLYQLQEEGYSFPGRMRDHVAEAVGASKSKLSRLNVIRSKLVPAWMRLWEENKLPESVAYTLAGAYPVRQNMIYDSEVKRYGVDFPCPSQGQIENILREMDKAYKLCGELRCFRLGSNGCDHKHIRLQKAAKSCAYSALPCKGCCRDCDSLSYCGESCEYASDIKQKQREKLSAERAESAAAKKAEKAAQKTREQAQKDLLALSYRRVLALRTTNDVSAKEFVKASTGYEFSQDVDRLDALESGKVKLTDRMPGGIWANEAQHLIAVADLLGCSIDYLMGRDTPEPPQTSGSCWHTGHPEESGEYIVLYSILGGRADLVDKAYWNGSEWMMFKRKAPEEVDISLWCPMPGEGLDDD